MNKLFLIIVLSFLIFACDSEDRSSIGHGLVTGVAAGVASSATHHAIQSWKDRRAMRPRVIRGWRR